jgi:opacity protein-like surface antigen
MLNRTGVRLLMLLSAALFASVVPAAAQQTLNFSVGYFTPRGEDARVEGDVLNANRNFLVFDVGDFAGASVGAEWLLPIGQYLEGGAGLSFSRRTVASVYEDFVDDDGTEIDQDLRLRLVPVSFTLRVLPLGQASPVQPYFGAGVGIFNWRYSEVGEFIDFGDNRAIFRDQFVADGNRAGAVVLGGLRFAGESVSAGGEVRYHKAEADLDDRFAGSKIDLGGWVYNFTVGIRFR